MVDTHKLVSKRTGLFNSFTDDEFQSLITHSTMEQFSSGELIVREGDQGDALYIIISGFTDVFTVNQAGDELLLAQLQTGDYFGEQALLASTPQTRNASVRANSNTLLLKVSHQDFQQTLQRDPALQDKLVTVGKQQLRSKVLRQSSLFRAVKPADLSGDWYQEIVFDDNQVIFSEGEQAESLYLIINGTAEVSRKEGDEQKLLAQLRAGQCFGELALLQKKPRAATITAQESLRVLRIDGNKFIQLYEQIPEMREYLQTLQKVYNMSGRGFVTQHVSQFMGMEAITTMYHMINGINAIAYHVIGKNIVNMTLSDSQSITTESLLFDDLEQGIKRELLISNNQIISVTTEGFWSELGRIYEMILNRTALDDIEIETFRQTGFISPEKQAVSNDPNQVICQCLQINLSNLRQVMQTEHCHTAGELTKFTGASTVCGSCRFLLQEIAEGKPEWMPVSLSQRIPITEQISTFRFIPLNGRLQPAKPGQHIVVQAKIDDKWVHRTYTLTSACDELLYREITVKRIENGVFSNWLFDNLSHASEIRISQPAGEYFVDLDSDKPIVCLVAGVGFTPALAIVRAFIQRRAPQPLFVDYCVSDPDQFAYREEFLFANKAFDNVSVNLRVSREERIKEQDINELVTRYPDAEFYICGPNSYQDAVSRYLRNGQVNEARIHIESFVVPETEQLAEYNLFNRSYFYLGLALLAVFLIQDLFQIKSNWLEHWQQNNNYKIWSGFGVMLFIAAQWIFPVLRIRKRSVEAARHYTIHKQIGAFAPLVYFIHSTNFGYGLIFMLSAVYFSNNLLGLFNHDLIKTREGRRQYSNYWLAPHIILSVLTVALMIYHMIIAFYYE